MIRTKKGIYLSDFGMVILFFIVGLSLFILSSCFGESSTTNTLKSEEELNRKVQAQVYLKKAFEIEITEEHLNRIPNPQDLSSLERSSLVGKNLSEFMKIYFNTLYPIHGENYEYGHPLCGNEMTPLSNRHDITNLIYSLLGEPGLIVDSGINRLVYVEEDNSVFDRYLTGNHKFVVGFKLFHSPDEYIFNHYTDYNTNDEFSTYSIYNPEILWEYCLPLHKSSLSVQEDPDGIVGVNSSALQVVVLNEYFDIEVTLRVVK